MASFAPIIVAELMWDIHIYIYVYIYIHTYIYIYMHTYIHYITLRYVTLHYITYIHTYITYIHTYIYTHPQQYEMCLSNYGLWAQPFSQLVNSMVSPSQSAERDHPVINWRIFWGSWTFWNIPWWPEFRAHFGKEREICVVLKLVEHPRAAKNKWISIQL